MNHKRSQVLSNLNIPGISMADPMLPVLPRLVLVSQSVYDTCSKYGNLADTSIDFLSLVCWLQALGGTTLHYHQPSHLHTSSSSRQLVGGSSAGHSTTSLAGCVWGPVKCFKLLGAILELHHLLLHSSRPNAPSIYF